MEDRLTGGLYLELCDVDSVEYSTGRMTELLRGPGIAAASSWENLVPNRADLPRTIPEFGVLGLYEVDDTFTPPAPPDGITGLRFRRYPRPGQGSLSGKQTLGLSVVLISPKRPEQAQELRDWADFVHIRHISDAAVPGYTMITPYENVSGGKPRYLHLYEMDTTDPEASFQAMSRLVQERLGPPGTPAFDEWAWHPALWIEYVNTFRRSTGWHAE
jgi:hypothetical protein